MQFITVQKCWSFDLDHLNHHLVHGLCMGTYKLLFDRRQGIAKAHYFRPASFLLLLLVHYSGIVVSDEIGPSPTYPSLLHVLQ